MQFRTLLSVFAMAIVIIGCFADSNDFKGTDGEPFLSIDGRQFELTSVYCSERMRRITGRFDEGVLYVSEHYEDPGYEVVLRITSPQRREFVNHDLEGPTGGLILDIEKGIHGDIRLMPSMAILDPDQHGGAIPIKLETRIACPG